MATRRARLRNIPKLNTSAAETKGDDPTITNDWLSAAMTDAELASADIYELIERRHCLTIGRTFDREDWERRRRAVEQFRASMAAENARIGIIAGGSAADASQRSEARL